MNQNPRYKEKNSKNSATGNQFIPTPVRAHRHTGQDSLQVDYNSLLNKPTTTSSAFAGSVHSSGTATFLPTGWTSSVGGMGGFHYTITHNLGTTSYAAAFTVAGPGVVLSLTPSASSFDVVVCDLGGSPQNFAFTFILVLNT